ncbi:two component transcriptional regulator, LuxR family [Pseudooceanicola antarcticus]|uniref:DNA-binding response regulator n=1 Tax=Pseudooceanicola antarcticus TaxID=1247613 RepID=A0A285J0U5_9RHOB|nr:response regulator transcription factor [Pseudooceanicola antarcticus]PJE25754.1 DNA-binding response regulator [Pseudooceanicola antarcticus]SNY52986.1 two component transcriptional regulator, LuxR family [Pseudooceanicola antarcticus]
MTRILFVDDHALLRDTLAAWLRARGWTVDCHDSLAQALAAPGADLIMVDLRLRGLNMHDGLSRLRAGFGSLPIVIMAGAHDAEEAGQALSAGADILLGKARPPEEIHRELRGLIDEAAHPGPDLSTREIEVLSGLTAGLSNKEIARDLGLQEVTVKLHMQRLCRKLGARNRTHAALIGRDIGLV